MVKRFVKEDVCFWLNNNMPNIELVHWGGKAKEKSVFFNSEENKEFEIEFSTLKRRFRNNPNTVFGVGGGGVQKLSKDYLIDNLPLYLVLMEWGGTFSALSVFKDLRTNCVFKRSAACLMRELRDFPNRKYGVGRGGNNCSSIEKQQKLLNRYSSRYRILNYVSPGEGKSRFLDLETGKEFDYYSSSFLSSLNNNNAFVPNSDVSGLETYFRKNVLSDDFGVVTNKKLEGVSYKPDFFLPDYRVVVECDGLYWHSEVYRHKEYHKEKLDAYESLGYRALFFREDEILRKPYICSSIVNNVLGLSRRVGARKTKCVVLEDVSFFEENHLMGKGQGQAYGLVYNGEIVAGMQVRWLCRKSGILDVSRFCPRVGVNVVGGFSKLLKVIEMSLRPNKIQTFIDRRYGNGSYLGSLGFDLKSNYLSFKWTDFKDTYHRMKYRGSTGYDYGLQKIWDCGQAKWVKCLS